MYLDSAVHCSSAFRHETSVSRTCFPSAPPPHAGCFTKRRIIFCPKMHIETEPEQRSTTSCRPILERKRTTAYADYSKRIKKEELSIPCSCLAFGVRSEWHFFCLSSKTGKDSTGVLRKLCVAFPDQVIPLPFPPTPKGIGRTHGPTRRGIR